MPVTVRFCGDLPDLARASAVEVPVDGTRAAKDAIESCGVPHTEVGRIVRNGTEVDSAAPVADGDDLEVHPVGTGTDIAARFVLDVHLGRLAERLRLLGFDTLYRNDRDDPELAAISARERRWLLTCDRKLLMRNVVTHGYLVRSRDPAEQTTEVLRRFHIADQVAPFTRCVRCNGLLAEVAKSEVEHVLEPGTRARHDEFVRCRSCGQIYWGGAHHAALREFIAEVGERAVGR